MILFFMWRTFSATANKVSLLFLFRLLLGRGSVTMGGTPLGLGLLRCCRYFRQHNWITTDAFSLFCLSNWSFCCCFFAICFCFSRFCLFINCNCNCCWSRMSCWSLSSWSFSDCCCCCCCCCGSQIVRKNYLLCWGFILNLWICSPMWHILSNPCLQHLNLFSKLNRWM